MKTGHYVIKIRLKDGSLRYVSITETCSYPRPSFIKSKGQATRFDHRGIANIVSDWMWSNYWNKDEFDVRSCEFVKSRGEK